MKKCMTPNRSKTRPFSVANGLKASASTPRRAQKRNAASLGDEQGQVYQPAVRKRRGSTGHTACTPQLPWPLPFSFIPGYAACQFLQNSQSYYGCYGPSRPSITPRKGTKKTPKKPYPRKIPPGLARSVKKAKTQVCVEKKPPVAPRKLSKPAADPPVTVKTPKLDFVTPNYGQPISAAPTTSIDGMNEYWEAGVKALAQEVGVESGVDVLEAIFGATWEALPLKVISPDENEEAAEGGQGQLPHPHPMELSHSTHSYEKSVVSAGVLSLIEPLDAYKAIEKALEPENRQARLVGRDSILSDLVRTVRDMFDRDQFGVVWISGGAGTGRFSLMREVFSESGYRSLLPNHRIVKLDYRDVTSLLVLAEHLYPGEDIDLLHSMEDNELLTFFQYRTRSGATPLVVLLDIAPGVLTSQPSHPSMRLLRSFLHLPTLGHKILFVVRNRYGPRRFLEWQAEGSRPYVIHLPPYNKFQLLSIFTARIPDELKAQAAFVIPIAVVNHIAGIVARFDGDCRKFLTMCQMCVKRKISDLTYEQFAIRRATGAFDTALDVRPLTLADSADIAGAVIERCIRNQWCSVSTPPVYFNLHRTAAGFARHLAGLAVVMATATGSFGFSTVAEYFRSLSRAAGFEKGITTPASDILLLCWPLERQGVVSFFGDVNGTSSSLPLAHQQPESVYFQVHCPSGLDVFVDNYLWQQLISSLGPLESDIENN